MAEALKDVGVSRLNISLDLWIPKIRVDYTRRNAVRRIKGLEAAKNPASLTQK